MAFTKPGTKIHHEIDYISITKKFFHGTKISLKWLAMIKLARNKFLNCDLKTTVDTFLCLHEQINLMSKSSKMRDHKEWLLANLYYWKKWTAPKARYANIDCTGIINHHLYDQNTKCEKRPFLGCKIVRTFFKNSAINFFQILPR